MFGLRTTYVALHPDQSRTYGDASGIGRCLAGVGKMNQKKRTMKVKRRQFLKMAGGAALVATLPKALTAPVGEYANIVTLGAEPNVIDVTVTGLNAEDHVYACVIDGKGKPISEVYEMVKFVTRGSGEMKAVAEVPAKFAGEKICIYARDNSKDYETFYTEGDRLERNSKNNENV
jgi:hypothetical protein